MNKLQKMILIVATVMFVGMGLFPPWGVVINGEVLDMGYSLIVDPPSREFSVHIDITRLAIQWAVVGVSAAVAFFLTKTDKP